jgi:hypothetical protein
MPKSKKPVAYIVVLKEIKHPDFPERNPALVKMDILCEEKISFEEFWVQHEKFLTNEKRYFDPTYIKFVRCPLED